MQEIKPRKRSIKHMAKNCLSLCLQLVLVITVNGGGGDDLKSDRLCRQCSKCDASECPPSEDYPHMTAFDDTLIAGSYYHTPISLSF